MKKILYGIVVLCALSVTTGCSTANQVESTTNSTMQVSNATSSNSSNTVSSSTNQNTKSPTSNTPPKVNTVKSTVKQIPNVENSIQCTSFVTPSDGWSVIGHDILATTNGGQTWSKRSAINAVAQDIGFVSLKQGWLFTGSHLKVTGDGGRTWHNETVPHLSGITLRQVQFLNDKQGWIMGTGQGKMIPDPKHPGSGRIPSIVVFWSTTNGGKTWSRINVPTQIANHEFYRYCYFDFISKEQGFLLMGSQPGAGQQGKSLYRTTDGGQDWSKVTSTHFNHVGQKHGLPGGGYISGVDFLNQKVGWLSETRGPVYITTNGGQTWKALTSQHSLQNLTDVQFLNSQHGYGIYHKALLMTRNGGRSWHQVYPGLWPTMFTAAQFFNAQDGISAGTLVDPRAILRTTDGGFTWRQIASAPGKGSIIAIDFPDPEHGWVITSHFSGTSIKRILYQTTDGGQAWKDVHSTTEEKNLYTYLSFVNSQTGFIESGWGHLFVTHNGGKSLTEVNNKNSGGAQIQFASTKFGWEIMNRHLYSTSDGGKTWNKILVNYSAINFDMVNAKTVWVIAKGDSSSLPTTNPQPSTTGIVSLLLSTSNGGQSWTIHQLGKIHAADVIFTDATHGWLVDVHGHYFHTNNGGRTWTQVNLLKQ